MHISEADPGFSSGHDILFGVSLYCTYFQVRGKRVRASNLLQKMLFEFAVCPVSRPQHELIAMNLKSKRLSRLVGMCIRSGDFYLESCSFLGYHFEASFERDDLNDEFAVPDNDAFNSDAAGASAANYFCLCAVQFCAGQFGCCSRAACIHVAAQQFLRVACPQVFQRRVEFVFLRATWNIVVTQRPPLS